MLLDIADEVVAKIGEQYRAAVASAVRTYPDVREDEDSVTGAFSHAMRENVHGAQDGYVWETRVRKLRGRGKDAAEKKIGADMSIELEVVDPFNVRRRKTLMAQAKKEWRGASPDLERQAGQIASLPGGGLVIDYGPSGFRATTAEDACAARGNAGVVRRGGFQPLADALSKDFLNCRVGSTAVFYDASHEQLLIFRGPYLETRPFFVTKRIRTVVYAP